MIPKVIHYCWLSGDPIPEKLQRCMDSWKKFLPDYEFVLWDLERFDIKTSQWVKEAFEARKYAFAADYIRLYAVYNYGGIYMDMDVEVVRPFDDLLASPYILGLESEKGVEAGNHAFCSRTEPPESGNHSFGSGTPVLLANVSCRYYHDRLCILCALRTDRTI